MHRIIRKKLYSFSTYFPLVEKAKNVFFILEVKTSQKKKWYQICTEIESISWCRGKNRKKCSTQIYFHFTWIKKGRKLIFLKLIKINSKYDKNFQADVQAKLHKKTCQTPSAFREKQTSWCNGVKYYTRIKRKMLKSEKESWREKFLTSLLLRIIQIFLI